MTGRICGTGSCFPKLRVTNDDLSKLMDTSDEWIRSRTGIEARYIAVGETTTDMAAIAAK
ncbi:MAG TPA: 3-oxoacyl-ACP synthase, partial [Lachnospiraceae bacterium]|nr:3-oxoacyl-ACP synthase [Lachnospiraceae bacterium]